MQEKFIPRKIVLSLAGVLAAAAFAPEASAIPAFARQVGKACTACHMQHFPVLNSYGRDFKASGYTMMGSQGKIKDEHLSIPNTLNAAMLIKLRYQKTNGTDTAAAAAVSGTTTNSGQWQIPDEFSLFFGGRIAENIGFLNEISLIGATTVAGAVTAQFKFPVMFDTEVAKLSVIPFMSDTGSMGYGYELGSTGLVRALRWSEDRAAISAAGYLGFASGPATGISFVAQNDMGYINLTRWAPQYMAGGNGNNGGALQLRSNWLRIAATPTVADWAMHIGLGVASGTSWNGATPAAVGLNTAGTATAVTPAAAATQVDTKATTLDFQGQTQLAEKDFSLYASYGRTPGSPAVGVQNLWNANPNAAKAFTVGADYSVIPHILHIGGSIRRADNGLAAFNKDNAIMVQGIYDLAQNVALHLVHTKNSGSAYDVGGPLDTSVAGNTGDALTTFMLEAAW